MNSTTELPPVIDQEYLKTNYLDTGFGYLLPELLELCRQQADASLAALERYLSAKDFQSLANEAHLIKGTAGTAGVGLLAHRAHLIEREAKTADDTTLSALLADLKEAVRQTDAAISNEIQRLKNTI